MKYQRLLAILLVMGLLFAVLPMGAWKAQALDVCAEGCSYTTIQAAVDAAANGDTITVGPGTYVEQVVITKNLSLIGVGAPTIKPTITCRFALPEQIPALLIAPLSARKMPMSISTDLRSMEPGRAVQTRVHGYCL